MNIGFSIILDTTDEEDVQKLGQIMQVFAEQSTTVAGILISKAVRWDTDNAAVAGRSDTVPTTFAAEYGKHPAGL
ncbi:hypothetical protein [Pectobacterium phage PPWS1]|uniref:Uncharacterized protein n=2 Tax=Kotilavirus TaxID=2732921 RepID=A0A3G9ESD4_9CAUD|nr:hypothetical protein HOR09_gp17 [Pectobacterium phage PPWS1]YP_009816187.1 hypothetical protein HOU58_gp26 [Pectobacterium phage PPWS2]BAS69532.1 hypothetical protein [Pectobacterium phage PPWS1]BBD74658.1 hypothetical protein [Pectobacterium phage PPWS2]